MRFHSGSWRSLQRHAHSSPGMQPPSPLTSHPGGGRVPGITQPTQPRALNPHHRSRFWEPRSPPSAQIDPWPLDQASASPGGQHGPCKVRIPG